MKKLFLVIGIIFNLYTSFGQHHDPHSKHSKNPKDHKGPYYISIEEYKLIFKKAPDLKDPSSYFIIQGDTLVAAHNIIINSVPFEYKDETFLNIYKTVAFNDAHKSKDGKSHLKFWKKGVKVFFSESVPTRTQKNIKDFAKEISEGIDSLKISFVKDLTDANYVIYLAGDFEHCPNLEKSEVDYYINWNGKNQITKGYIKIDSKKFFTEKLLTEKMKELFVQSLGFFKTTDKLNCSSFFSYCYEEGKKFSALDKEILKYHYSYGICKGIDEETFDNLHENAENYRKSNPNIPYTVRHYD